MRTGKAEKVMKRYLGTQAPETTLKPATLRRTRMSDASRRGITRTHQEVALVLVSQVNALAPQGKQIPRAAYSAVLQVVDSQLLGLPVDRTFGKTLR